MAPPPIMAAKLCEYPPAVRTVATDRGRALTKQQRPPLPIIASPKALLASLCHIVDSLPFQRSIPGQAAKPHRELSHPA
jgi:hypothetical protein